MAQNPQAKLESIFSYSFPANHLLQVSIVKQPSEQSYKKEFFCFITLAPGVQSPQGGRSFDFNNRVTMKVEGHQVTALAHAMRAYVRGQEAIVGPFSIYVDSSKSAYGQGGGGKSMMIQRTTNQKQNNAPMLTFFFKVGSNQALGYSMTPANALAAADVFEFIGKKCLELEFSRGPATAQTGAYENPAPVGFADPVPGAGMPNQFAGAATPPNPAASNVAGNFQNTFSQFEDTPF
jgi:hypothetical protein